MLNNLFTFISLFSTLIVYSSIHSKKPAVQANTIQTYPSGKDTMKMSSGNEQQ